MKKEIIVYGKKLVLVNTRISIDGNSVMYVFFDGKEEHLIKDSQYKEFLSRVES